MVAIISELLSSKTYCLPPPFLLHHLHPEDSFRFISISAHQFLKILQQIMILCRMFVKLWFIVLFYHFPSALSSLVDANGLLKPVYDFKTPPQKNDSTPVKIQVSFVVRDIEEINEMKMEYKIQLTLRIQWEDHRIAYNTSETDPRIPIVSSGDLAKQIWTPDLFFFNEKAAKLHNQMKPNVLIHIYSNGEVLFSTRFSLTLSCPMDLRFFPMDRQTCCIIMASYAWSTQFLVLEWKKHNPIEITNVLTLSNFKLKGFKINSFRFNATVGEYGLIKLDFFFEREFSYYLIAIYCPGGMIVIISWISFWLGENSIDARVSLGFTTILTMVTQIYGISQNAPPVSYIKALDVWTGSCLFFVVMTVVEVSMVSVYSRRRHWSQFAAEFSSTRLTYKTNQTGSHIDMISRIMFPVAFLMFNVSYWSAYLLTEQSARVDYFPQRKQFQ